MTIRFAVFIAVSLDGYIARSDGSLDWLYRLHAPRDEYDAFFAGVDALVIGRGTYDTVREFPEWPYGDKRVVVCTNRPLVSAHGEEAWAGPVRALADTLAQKGVRRVYVDGGVVVRDFLREQLIDEMTITIAPLLLGAGRPLFASGLPELSLALRDVTPYPSGLVRLRYQRA